MNFTEVWGTAVSVTVTCNLPLSILTAQICTSSLSSWAWLGRLGLNNGNMKLQSHPGTHKSPALEANTGLVFSQVKELPLTEHSVPAQSHKITTAKTQSFSLLSTASHQWQLHPGPFLQQILTQPPKPKALSASCHNWILALDFTSSFSTSGGRSQHTGLLNNIPLC